MSNRDDAYLVTERGLCPYCHDQGSDVDLEFEFPRRVDGLKFADFTPDKVEILAGCFICGHVYRVIYSYSHVESLEAK